ncbi:two-component system, NarL family, capsular synthesis sensor histidine kinase RcsC [Pseudomonas delhiensis]|uniref:histidine kinase n=1 Tax=Pseudomonas delhiensis TaxID=366289 RepID=A0A239NNA5_9PSED|nr:ATP-binding protein [Pseudomonas delhiensis]SDL15175.1 two-component system, NarL family, capsular synthesis sensor histidine kinase RcsC [Pseudomonas delhiensis]SNT56397.1 two-component system, NarL family, capsular synthesis sensor histidine kinase RcsC [Pseudomonas delhiensis]
MATPSQDDVLRRLRHHQYLLVGGGGLLITLAVLITCLLEIWAVTRGHLDQVQDEISLDARQLGDFKTRVSANVRNNVQSIELALRATDPVDTHLPRAFRLGGHALRVQASADAHPLLVLGASTESAPEDAWPYLQLAYRLSPLVSITRERATAAHSIYLYSTDKRHVLISALPWPGDAWQRRLASERGALMERLTAGLDRSGDSPKTSAPQPGAELRWFEPYESPLTGKQVLRIAAPVHDATGKAFGNVVYELPVDSVKQQFSGLGASADYLILDDAGRLVISSRGFPRAELPAISQEVLDNGLGRSHRRDFKGGQVLYGWSLGQSGWTLVYALGWRDVVDGLGLQLLVPVFAALAIILITWVFLFLIKRRVLAPAVSQSQRVFENEQLSRTLIQTAPLGLALLVVESGEVLLRSPAMQAMQGRISGREGDLPDELARRYRQRVAAALPGTGPEPLHEDLTFTALDGEVLNLSASMAPVRYQERDALVAAFIDITDKKRLERFLLEARDAADKANAAKSSFLAAMSHEIRTPLNAILGNLELLAHSALDFQRDRLDTIRRASDSLLAIVSDVLDFSKIEAGELRLERIEFDLFDVASRSLSIFAPVARAKGLSLYGELGDTATQPMLGDPTRVGQVLNNLLSNAIKFTEHGHVTLRIRVDTAASRVVLEVEDSGIGMSEMQRQRIFHPFSQADESINRRYGGTGLGLTLCQRLTQAMGGELSVHSEAGQGSLFRFGLPLEPGLAPAELPAFDGERVALLAAMPEQRAYLERVLRAWGLQVGGYQHPVQLDEQALTLADALVLWGDRMTWCAADENRLVEQAAWVIDCSAEGPGEPTAAGRVLSASVHGLKGLAGALRHALHGQPLPTRAAPQWELPKRLRVLVAEDNPVNRRLFEEQLQLLGCDAHLVEDGEQALGQLQRTSFDLLLTDLSMPGLDGYALARQAGELRPQMPVVVATANVTLQERERCKAAGVAQVLTKPLSLEALARALRETCGTDADDRSGAPSPATDRPPGRPAKRGWLGGMALPADVRREFEKASAQSHEAIQQAVRRHDTEAVLRELHSLRGALGVFQMEQLSQQAAEVDEQVRRLGCEGAAGSIAAFCDNLESTVLQAPGDAGEAIDRLVELAMAGPGERVAEEVRRLGSALRQMLVQR